MNKEKKISVPENLFANLQAYLEQSMFASVDDLAAYILQDFLDKQTGGQDQSSEDGNKIIEERLRNLGYL